jgi:hypothetical protein
LLQLPIYHLHIILHLAPTFLQTSIAVLAGSDIKVVKDNSLDLSPSAGSTPHNLTQQ